MAASASTGMLIDTSALTPSLQNLQTAEELKGALESELMARGINATKSAAYAELIVEEACYDTSAAIADLTLQALGTLKIPLGHRAVCIRAVFQGYLPAQAAGTPVPISTPAPVMYAGAAAEYVPRHDSAIRREWPVSGGGLMTAADLKDFGLTVRAVLNEANKPQLAAEFWRRFTDVSAPIPSTYAHADSDDAWLARILVSAGKIGMPRQVSQICAVHVQNDHGMRATQAICQRVFLHTEDAVATLKATVRNPNAPKDSSKVADGLSTWDSNRAEALARGYVFDQHDLRTALYGMVSKCDEFKPAVQALKRSVPGGYPSIDETRKALGDVAADLERRGPLVAPKKKGKSAAAKKNAKRRARVKAAAAEDVASNTTQAADSFSAADVKDIVKAMVAEVTKINVPCREFAAGGTCRFGERCKFLHGDTKHSDTTHSDSKHSGTEHNDTHVDPMSIGLSVSRFNMTNSFGVLSESKPPKKKDKFVALMAELYDGVRRPKDLVRVLSFAMQTCGRSSKVHHIPRTKVPRNKRVVGVAAVGKPVVKKGTKRSRRRKEAMPVADTGANEHFVGTENVSDVSNVRKVQPVAVDTAGGTVLTRERADLHPLMDSAYMLLSTDESLCSVGKVCEKHNLGYAHTPGNRRAFFFDENGNVHTELSKDDRRFRLPVDSTDPMAAAAALAAEVPSWYREHAMMGHPFRPDCEHCVRGAQRERQSRKVQKNEVDKGNPGYTMSADFTGKAKADVDGHTVSLVACVIGFTDDGPSDGGDEAAYGFVALLEKRDTKSVASALDEFDAELHRLGRDKSRAIVRFHTDVDKSFLGDVKKLAIRRGWRQTDTGGYKSPANGIVERRIGMLRQRLRTQLLAATGSTSHVYYTKLWGHGMVSANDSVNRNDWKTRTSPHQQLTGSAYKYAVTDHVFGEYCTWGVPGASRESVNHPAAEQGIWIRKDPASVHCDVVVPISWDHKAGIWDLKPTVVVTRANVHSGVMPLRMKPANDSDGATFDKFIDAVFDPLLASLCEHEGEQAAAAESSNNANNNNENNDLEGAEPPAPSTPRINASDASEDDADSDERWEVERILNSRVSPTGQKLYLLKWKGFSRKYNSWEPEDAVTCPKLVKQYQKQVRSTKRAVVRKHAELRDLRTAAMDAAIRMPELPAETAAGDERYNDLMAVTELMAKQGLTGDPSEWLPGYRRELDSGKERRLATLTPEERAAAMRSRWLLQQGFEQSANEPCVFRKRGQRGSEDLLAALYVDDLLVRGTMSDSESFHSSLSNRFDCRGEASYLGPGEALEFLGFVITMEEAEDGTHVYMDQQDALSSFLGEMDMGGIRAQDCPMPSLVKLFSDPTLADDVTAKVYRHSAGFLNFLAKTTRFDIAHTVSMLCTQMGQPTMGAVKALRHLLGYLKQTTAFRIGGRCAATNPFDFYSDSDHASAKPHSTRSHTGAMLMLNTVPVAWLSKRQPITAVSPAEAEIHAMRDAIIAARLIQWVAEDMFEGVAWPLEMKTDSAQARSFQHNTCPNSKLRGCFDIRENSIQEMRDKKIVITKQIPRDHNLADLMTHCLTRSKFREQIARAQNFQRYNCKGACLNNYTFSMQLYCNNNNN